MSSMFNAGVSYPSSDGFERIIDNGAQQYTTASGHAESAQIESHQDWVLQRFEELMAAKAKIDAELREFQDLYHKLEYTRAQQYPQLPFPITATPYVPFTTTSPYSTTNSLHSFLSPSQGETWNIPNHVPPPSTSHLTIASHAQPATPSLPKYTVCSRAGNKVFRCECGHETSQKGDMSRHRKSLRHAKRSYICHCRKRYTRMDSLRRHEATHA